MSYLLLVGTALTTLSAPSFAQTTDVAAPPAQTQAEAVTGNAAESLNATTETSAADTIVVTGSRIRRPNIESAVPVTTIGAEDIIATGRVALGDLLNEMPSLRATRGQANSTAFIGTAGTNFLDLRGLGTVSTLVLQNGRRHVSTIPGQFTVDVNTIPTELVERIDVVTGGTSAVYGSDAVAGVVNFVLKRDFEGIQATGQAGISSRGDRESFRAALTAGTNFAQDRGNIAVSAEYTRADELDAGDRPNRFGSFRGRDQVQLIENPANEPGGSDGIADRTFTRNVRSLGLSEGGTFIASSGAASATGACATTAGCINGVPRIYRFRPDGTLAEADYGQDLRLTTNNNTGNQIGGDGSTLRRYGQLQPFVERYGINLLGHFDVTDAFSPYVEAKYVRYDIFQQSAPTFQSGGTQTGTAAAQTGFTANSSGVPIFLDNPYLNPQAAALIRSVLPAGQTAFRLQRNNIDLGSREETGYRETYRIVTGFEGDFNDDWHYDISANYGKFRQSLTSVNNRIQQRFRLAADAVRNPANGQIICRSQLPGQVTPTPTNAADAAALAADIAACVPVNLFGEGAPSAEAIAYFSADTVAVQRHEQKVVNGFITGDFSQLFELPGGPVGFAVGAEWRQEDGFRDFGDLVVNNRTFLTAISRFTPPEKFEVKEAFGELNVPLLADRPFAYELSLQGAARVADYKGAVGTVLAWNAGATYAPVEGIRLRVNYAVSVRAPTQFDLYAQLGQNFAQLEDPCDVRNINNGTATRAANCAAAGIPAGFVNAPARAGSTAFSNGGNPLLQEETSKSWTIGGVLTPRALPGFSLTVDYYDIKIEDVIGSPTAQQIVNSCYDSSDLNNVFCAVVRRDSSTNFFSTAAPEFGVVQGGINYSAGTARGVDFEASYQTGTAWGRLGTRLVGTYALERNDYPFLNEPTRPDQRLLEVGDPRLRLNWSANLQTGKFNFGYQGRYISKQAVASTGLGGGIEDIREVGGRAPQNADFADLEWIPDVFYHDLRVGYDFTAGINFYAGVDNMFDRQPPLGLLGNGSVYAADAIFDNVGRYFYAGAIVKF
jgi:outer membrane receptor protein involved in Fe transport